MSKQEEKTFPGFEPSNTTPVPDVFFDELMTILSDAELRVLLYIIRRTWGFKKATDAISFNQFIKGIKTRDGKQLDKGCGVKNRTTLSKALKGLEERGYIVSSKGKDLLGDNTVTVYSIRFRAAGAQVEGGIKSVPPVVSEMDHRSNATVPPVVRQLYPQETVRQKTVKQQTVVQEREKEPSQQQANAEPSHLLSSDQQIWFYDAFCHSKIGRVPPDTIDELFRDRITTLMRYASDVEALDSLYDHTKKEIEASNKKDKTVHLGNMVNKRTLNSWLQSRETPEVSASDEQGQPYDENLIFDFPPEHWTEEALITLHPVKEGAIRRILAERACTATK
jgi:hypothetical protein